MSMGGQATRRTNLTGLWHRAARLHETQQNSSVCGALARNGCHITTSFELSESQDSE
jgi:hypothetical protein